MVRESRVEGSRRAFGLNQDVSKIVFVGFSYEVRKT